MIPLQLILTFLGTFFLYGCVVILYIFVKSIPSMWDNFILYVSLRVMPHFDTSKNKKL